MLRLTELKLPLDHTEADLKAAILARLGIAPAELLGVTIFRRGYDARKKSNIHFIYTVDVELAQESAVAARHRDDPHTRPTPDMRYRYVAQAPEGFAEAYWAYRSLMAEGVTPFFICNALCAAWWIALYLGRQRLRRHVMVDQ